MGHRRRENDGPSRAKWPRHRRPYKWPLLPFSLSFSASFFLTLWWSCCCWCAALFPLLLFSRIPIGVSSFSNTGGGISQFDSEFINWFIIWFDLIVVFVLFVCLSDCRSTLFDASSRDLFIHHFFFVGADWNAIKLIRFIHHGRVPDRKCIFRYLSSW